MNIFSVAFRPRAGVFIAGMVLLLAACAGGPMMITDETTPAEIIQRAQEASDKNRYGLALNYYQALLERFPGDIELICTAEYEIAFIHYKQKKYTQARQELNALLERYDTPNELLLPRQFKRLAVIVLERITEKERTRDPISEFFLLFKT